MHMLSLWRSSADHRLYRGCRGNREETSPTSLQKTDEPGASRRAPARRSDAVRRSAGRSSAGADGRDQAIQLEEKGLSCCPILKTSIWRSR